MKKKKKYSAPRTRMVKIAVSHLLTESTPPQGKGSDYEWGD